MWLSKHEERNRKVKGKMLRVINLFISINQHCGLNMWQVKSHWKSKISTLYCTPTKKKKLTQLRFSRVDQHELHFTDCMYTRSFTLNGTGTGLFLASGCVVNVVPGIVNDFPSHHSQVIQSYFPQTSPPVLPTCTVAHQPLQWVRVHHPLHHHSLVNHCKCSTNV